MYSHFRFIKILLIVCCLSLAGCASFGRGVAQAILGHAKQPGLGDCDIESPGFLGVADYLKRPGEARILMIHGVGHHLPGYATRLMENLTKELELNHRDKNYKEIRLVHPLQPKTNLGTLRVHHFYNPTKKQSLLFYELTWSEITQDEKAVLD